MTAFIRSTRASPSHLACCALAISACGTKGEHARLSHTGGAADSGACGLCASRPDCAPADACADFGGPPPGLAPEGGGVPVERFGAVTGQVAASGGRVSRLAFAVVGDTRPASIDDTAGYPTQIITTIFEDVQSLDPPVSFAVTTGDYVFASNGGGQAAPQLEQYLSARRRFSGVVFAALGNHECTGATASNCGDGNADGVTENYQQFLDKLIQPLGQTHPYYAVAVDSLDAAWTAKIVVVASNAWDADQAAWLEAALDRPTTYTFVVRHEPASATRAPGVQPAEAILSRHPYTLSIVGHSHTCERSGAREVIFGNGGAPLTSSAHGYGFGLVQQRPDGAVQIDAVDYATRERDPAFSFALRADGSPAP